MDQKKKRVAVIGSGISGLACAWALSFSEGAEVTLFERHGTLGMDAHSIDLPGGLRLDTPPRSINAAHYPHLLQLYHAAGVELEQFSWDFSFSQLGSPRALLCAATLAGRAIPHRGGSWLAVGRVCRDALRLYSRLVSDLATPEASGLHSLTWGAYLSRLGLSDDYTYGCLMPALATWLTASYEGVHGYPAVIVAEFLCRHSMGANYHTRHGSQDAIKRLSTHAARVLLNTRVLAVHPSASAGASSAVRAPVPATAVNGVHEVHVNGSHTGDVAGSSGGSSLPAQPAANGTSSSHNGPTSSGSRSSSSSGPSVVYVGADGVERTEHFDAVIMATQANHALSLVQDMPQELQEALKSFQHEWSEVVMHTDAGAAMPPNRSDWMPANFVGDRARGQGSCTLWFTLPGPGPEPKSTSSTSTGNTTSSSSANGSTNGSSAHGQGAGSMAAEGAACAECTARKSDCSPAACAAHRAGEGGQAASSSSGSSERQKAKQWSLFQTWNPLSPVDPALELARYGFERPLVTTRTPQAIRSLWAHQGQGGVWFIGAYTQLAVPLQEAATVSGLRVAAALGCPAPWLGEAVRSHPLRVDHTLEAVAARAVLPPDPTLVRCLPPPPATASRLGSLLAQAVQLLPFERASGVHARVQGLPSGGLRGSRGRWQSSGGLEAAAGQAGGGWLKAFLQENSGEAEGRERWGSMGAGSSAVVGLVVAVAGTALLAYRRGRS